MKVAMYGGSPALDMGAALSHGAGWEHWCLNNCWPIAVRWDRWFNIHQYGALKKNWPKGLAQEIAWAHMNPKVPCYVIESWGGVLPNERIFPRDKLARQPRGWYHCGSIDWMVAYAIHLKATEIAIHGVSLAMESGEPLSAWPCLEYWCGYAEGRGIKVTVHEPGLFANYRVVRDKRAYGYDEYDLITDVT